MENKIIYAQSKLSIFLLLPAKVGLYLVERSKSNFDWSLSAARTDMFLLKIVEWNRTPKHVDSVRQNNLFSIRVSV